MQTKIIRFTSVLLLSVIIIMTIFIGVTDYCVPSRQSYYKGQKPKEYAFVSLEGEEAVEASVGGEKIESISMTAKLFGVLPLKKVKVHYYDKISLYVGGFPFGVKFFTDGIVVVNLTDVITESGNKNPAYEAGLRTNDII
ncbi:MAG: hypothetical protein U0M06_03730, partial [Clostridia bacterium]|nr:hypothetical protein [Clostridia bacterium]